MSLRCHVIRHLTSWLHCIQHPENISLTQWQELHQDVWIIPKLCCAAIERRLNAVQSWTTKGNDCIISLVWKQHKSSTDKRRRHLHIFVLHVVVVLQDCWDALLLLLWDLLTIRRQTLWSQEDNKHMNNYHQNIWFHGFLLNLGKS